MEKTYNDIVAENQALKKENRKLKREYETQKASANIWMGRYYDLAKQIRTLKQQLDDERIITNAIAGKRGLLEEASAIRKDFARSCGYYTDVRQPRECKIISINPLNK